jgi:hypothetical protein
LGSEQTGPQRIAGVDKMRLVRAATLLKRRRVWVFYPVKTLARLEAYIVISLLSLSEQLVVVPLILVRGAFDYLASFRGNTFIVDNVTPI